MLALAVNDDCRLRLLMARTFLLPFYRTSRDAGKAIAHPNAGQSHNWHCTALYEGSYFLRILSFSLSDLSGLMVICHLV
jgi:hypothetical protein